MPDTRVSFEQAENIAWMLNEAIDEIQEGFTEESSYCKTAPEDTWGFFEEFRYGVHTGINSKYDDHRPVNIERRIENVIREYPDAEKAKEINRLELEKTTLVDYQLREAKFVGDPLKGTIKWLDCFDPKDKERVAQIEKELIYFAQKIEAQACVTINKEMNIAINNMIRKAQETHLKTMKDAMVRAVCSLAENKIPVTDILITPESTRVIFPRSPTPKILERCTDTNYDFTKATGLTIPTAYISNCDPDEKTKNKSDFMLILYDDRYGSAPIEYNIITKDKVIIPLEIGKEKALFNQLEKQLESLQSPSQNQVMSR